MVLGMDDKPLNPFGRRDLGTLLADTFTIYGRNIVRLIGVAAVAYVPLLIAQMIMTYTVPTDGVFGVILLMIAITISLFFSMLLIGAMIHAIAQHQLLPKIGIRRAYQLALKRFWRILGATLLKGLAIFLMTITVIGIPAAIYFAIRWSFMEQAIIIEGHGVGDAFTRSTRLVKNGWWRIFGMLLLWWAIYAALSSVVQAPAYIMTIQNLMNTINAETSYLLSDSTMTSLTVIGYAVGIFLVPLGYLFPTLLFLDLRSKKEEFTPEMLAEDMGMVEEYQGYNSSPTMQGGA
jgi:hypothetical protein